MKRNSKSPKSIFQEIGKVRWTQFDAFAVKTKRGATFLLSPNSDDGVPTRVHIDEIEVPESLRRRGVATDAMTALCWLKWGIIIEGLCIKSHAIVRSFESLVVELKCKNPVVVNYSYIANIKGKSYVNEGFILFSNKSGGRYLEANGHFMLPHSSRTSKQSRNAMIYFQWLRIPSAEIRVKTGKRSLECLDDVSHFLRRGGEL